MGRSAFDSVSDGEWSVFAMKVCEERDEALAKLAEYKELLERAVDTLHECGLRDEIYAALGMAIEAKPKDILHAKGCASTIRLPLAPTVRIACSCRKSEKSVRE